MALCHGWVRNYRHGSCDKDLVHRKLLHCAATFSTSGSTQTLSKNSFFGA
jgi:hypothetical protein